MEKRISAEEALSLHIQMWTDMQKELGDNPEPYKRASYKQQWCIEHGYKNVCANCFLCEYAEQNNTECSNCLIDWGNGYGCDDSEADVNYRKSPISEILALPEREDV